MRSFISLILVLAITACNSKSPKVLPSAKFEAVLTDYIKAEVFAQDFGKQDSANTKTSIAISLQKQLFAKHKISREEFLATVKYYNTHPQEFKPILDSINVHTAAISTKINADSDTNTRIPTKGLRPTELLFDEQGKLLPRFKLKKIINAKDSI